MLIDVPGPAPYSRNHVHGPPDSMGFFKQLGNDATWVPRRDLRLRIQMTMVAAYSRIE
jgi:hypothetical protein